MGIVFYDRYKRLKVAQVLKRRSRPFTFLKKCYAIKRRLNTLGVRTHTSEGFRLWGI